jgi:hypothetical protein
MPTRLASFIICLLLTAAAVTPPQRAAADDFRIETKVFVGKDTKDSDEPTAETLTLFRGGQVYDFLTKPNEITVFDKPRHRVILLDPVRKVQTEVKSDRLSAFTDQLKLWAAHQTDPLLKFAAVPRFEQTLDGATGEMVFASQFINYRIAARKADNEAIAREYYEFSNSYAMLNALTNPGSTPPFARMAINEALFKTGSLPEKVQVTVASKQRFGKPTVMRSEHAMHWRLLESDLQKISEADEFLVSFTPLPLESYLRTGQADSKR